MNEYSDTQNSVKALQTAEAMAQENHNNYLTPEHLLHALVDQGDRKATLVWNTM